MKPHLLIIPALLVLASCSKDAPVIPQTSKPVDTLAKKPVTVVKPPVDTTHKIVLTDTTKKPVTGLTHEVKIHVNGGAATFKVYVWTTSGVRVDTLMSNSYSHTFTLPAGDSISFQAPIENFSGTLDGSISVSNNMNRGASVTSAARIDFLHKLD